MNHKTSHPTNTFQNKQQIFYQWFPLFSFSIFSVLFWRGCNKQRNILRVKNIIQCMVGYFLNPSPKMLQVHMIYTNFGRFWPIFGRVDSVLFKTRILQDHHKCFQVNLICTDLAIFWADFGVELISFCLKTRISQGHHKYFNYIWFVPV